MRSPEHHLTDNKSDFNEPANTELNSCGNQYADIGCSAGAPRQLCLLFKSEQSFICLCRAMPYYIKVHFGGNFFSGRH